MKATTNRYVVMIKIQTTGQTGYDGYYGYTSRKEAEARAEKWNAIPDTEAWVVDTKAK